MNRPRLIRGLRFAWTAFFGVLCLLLIGLWIRSYWWIDYVSWGWGTPTKQVIASTSLIGAISLTYGDVRADATVTFPKWNVESQPTPTRSIFPIAGMSEAYAGFYYEQGRGGFVLLMPYWFLAPLALVISIAPWVRREWRFSIRTLFLVTTAVAVMLGLLVYATR